MPRIYAKNPDSWLPVRLILGAGYNAAHKSHLHVEGKPKKYGTPPLTNPGMPASTRKIHAAVKEFFPSTIIQIYNRRKISGTSTWSQHSWSNALDIFADGYSNQLAIFNMLTADTKPEGGGEEDMKEVYARLQASLIRAGHDLGNWSAYLPTGDPDSMLGADGSWGNDSRKAQDAANKVGATGTVDTTARKQVARANARLDNLHQI